MRHVPKKYTDNKRPNRCLMPKQRPTAPTLATTPYACYPQLHYQKDTAGLRRVTRTPQLRETVVLASVQKMGQVTSESERPSLSNRAGSCVTSRGSSCARTRRSWPASTWTAICARPNRLWPMRWSGRWPVSPCCAWR